MFHILVISVIVVIGVLLLSIFTINKGYSYKHSVDCAEDSPYYVKQDEDKPSNH